MRAEPSTSRRSCFLVLVLLPEEAATAETGGNEDRTRCKQRQQIERAATKASKEYYRWSNGSSDAVSHRRQLADVPRLPRLPRTRAVEPGGPIDARRLRFRHDAAKALRGSQSDLYRRLVRPGRAARFATRSPPTTKPTACRCRMTWSSRSIGSTRRARRWASRSSRCRATRPTMCSERSRRARPRQAIRWRSSRSTRTSFSSSATDAISVYDPREDGAWFDERGVLEKFGVKPSQVVDVLALVGDTSDNVAGVPGIGKKGATDLVTQYRQPRRPAGSHRGAEGKTARGTRRHIANRHCRAGNWSRFTPTRRSNSIWNLCVIVARRARAASSSSLVWPSGRWSTSTRRQPIRLRPTMRSSRPKPSLTHWLRSSAQRGASRST